MYMYIDTGMCTGTQIDFICGRRDEDTLQELVSLVITVTSSAVFQGVNLNFVCFLGGLAFFLPSNYFYNKEVNFNFISFY